MVQQPKVNTPMMAESMILPPKSLQNCCWQSCRFPARYLQYTAGKTRAPWCAAGAAACLFGQHVHAGSQCSKNIHHVGCHTGNIRHDLRCRGFEHFSQAVHHAFVIIQHFGCPAQIKAITVCSISSRFCTLDMYSGRLVNNMVMLETTCGTTMETNSVIISAATI